MEEKNLIFIASQPRSGSTFLQNLLSNNPETNTCSEPWLLLNFLNFHRPDLYTAKFNEVLALEAFKEYLKKYPNFDFNNVYKNFILNLYKPMLQGGFKFIVDKTPRYWEILNEIALIFPASKIIVLKRDPRDVVRSMIKSWHIKSLDKLNFYRRDLLVAPFAIQEFCEIQKDNPNVYSLKYEDLVLNTNREVENLYNWMGMNYNDFVLDIKNNLKYKGKYGDPYQNVETKHERVIERRDQSLDRKFEKFIAGYLNFLGKDLLNYFGEYSTDDCKPTKEFTYFKNLEDYDTKRYGLKKEILLRISRMFI